MIKKNILCLIIKLVFELDSAIAYCNLIACYNMNYKEMKTRTLMSHSNHQQRR